MHRLVLLGNWHTLLNIFSELLKIYIHISANRSHLLIHNFFNKPSLDSIQFLSWIHLIDCINFIVQMVYLFLASVESFLKVDQFSFEFWDLFEETFLLGHDQIVIFTMNTRAVCIFAKVEVNSIHSFLFVTFPLLLGRLSPRFTWSLALHDRGWRIRSKTWWVTNTALIMPVLVFESLDGPSMAWRLRSFFILLFETESWADSFTGARPATLLF